MRIPGWLATLPTQSRRFLNTEGTEEMPWVPGWLAALPTNRRFPQHAGRGGHGGRPAVPDGYPLVTP